MKTFLSIIFLIWELPQNILGALWSVILYLFGFTYSKDNGEDVEIYSTLQHGALSLGLFRFYAIHYDNSTANYVELCRKHEHGHQIQSRYLGPLYLIVIGIPSIVWAGLHRTKWLREKDYFWFYTEKWADKLGGVQR